MPQLSIINSNFYFSNYHSIAMKISKSTYLPILSILFILLLTSCAPLAPTPTAQSGPPRLLAVESFLADLTQNVAGERLQVETLIPRGLDPHSFEPAPADVARLADAQVLVVNGGGFESWLEKTLQNAGGNPLVIEASAGLQPRQPQTGEHPEEEHAEGDPHFWLDPTLAIHYVENIQAGLSQADPAGKELYAQNAAAYIAQLKELDAWIAAQMAQIPPERRLLVTDHESFGYYADRYGLRIVGAIIPSVSSGAAPSAQQLAALVDAIRSNGAPAVFLQSGANPKLAEQLASETGVRVVSGLYTHSLSEEGGDAPSYLEMMRFNTQKIVEALR
jgi:ABC-type Zn uptake system ZnuABC Zn-binding protein ZnuA